MILSLKGTHSKSTMLYRDLLFPHLLLHVIDGILSNVQFFCTIVFSHIKTDGNKPTHILAHHAKFVINFEA